MFYWCFLLIVFSHQKTIGRNTRTVYKTHWTVYKTQETLLLMGFLFCFVLFFSPSQPHTFEFHFFKHKSSEQSRCCWVCLPRAAVCTKLSYPGLNWRSFSATRDGSCGWASPPILPRRHWGNQIFFWGVAGCLLQDGSLLRAFCSSVPLVASADARFVDLCTPEPGLRAELEKRGKWVP